MQVALWQRGDYANSDCFGKMTPILKLFATESLAGIEFLKKKK